MEGNSPAIGFLYMDAIIRLGNLLAFQGHGEEAGHGAVAAEAAGHAAEGAHHGLTYAQTMVYIGFVFLVLIAIMAHARGGINNRVFTRKTTQWFEQLFLFVENMAVGIIGAHGRKYIPMVLTMWCVIFVSNVVSLFFPSAPTADLSFNLALAFIAVGYVQWEGIRANGFFGHLGHFAGPRMPGVLGLVMPLIIFPIEIVSELMKNVSLSLRLFGNIDGGHQAVTAMNDVMSNVGGSVVDVPLGYLLLPIKALTCVVQALVFTLLFCVYLSLVTHHAEDHGHEEHGHGELAPAH